MSRIFKYPLLLTQRQTIQVPSVRVPLSVQMQAGEICLWMQTEPEYSLVGYVITIVGTGNDIPDDAGFFIGTVQMTEFVWHIFGRDA